MMRYERTPGAPSYLVMCVQETHARVCERGPIPELKQVKNMVRVSRDQYMAALRAAEHVVSPTPENIHLALPHLNRAQVAQLLNEGERTFAMPPVLVRNSFRVGHYFPATLARRSRSLFVGGLTSRRTLESYADRMPRSNVSGRFLYMDEAMVYAETHWRHALTLDNWTDVLTVHIQDPNGVFPGPLGGLRTKSTIKVGINRRWEALRHDRSIPQVQQWEDAIVVATCDNIVAAEIDGGRDPHIVYNCSRCGGALSMTACSGCSTRFPDDGMRSPSSLSLPMKLIQVLRTSGHLFELPPERLLNDRNGNAS